MNRPDWRLHLLWMVLGGLLSACPSGGGTGPDSSGIADLAVADLRTSDLATADLRPADLGGGDLRPEDLGADDLRPEDLGASDAGNGGGPDLTPPDVPLAQGPCSGRAGHSCSGTITLYRTGSGTLELRFPSNFSVSPIPAGEVYLSSRSAFGASIDPSTDIKLANLQAFTGAQSYAVPAGADAGRPYAWIWCARVPVEVGVALLTPLP